MFFFTFNIFAMRWWTFLKTSLTSRDTVWGCGSRYSGLPVFMRLRKARSVTILNGRLFSATQRTISALWDIEYQSRWNNKLSNWPCFLIRMLTMRICHRLFPNTLKGCRDFRISLRVSLWLLVDDGTRCLEILGCKGCLNRWLPPTPFCVSVQSTSWFTISLI